MVYGAIRESLYRKLEVSLGSCVQSSRIILTPLTPGLSNPLYRIRCVGPSFDLTDGDSSLRKVTGTEF